MSQLGDITRDKEIETIEKKKSSQKQFSCNGNLLEAIQILYSTIKFNLTIENDLKVIFFTET